jgi:hypothetical protein
VILTKRQPLTDWLVVKIWPGRDTERDAEPEPAR